MPRCDPGTLDTNLLVRAEQVEESSQVRGCCDEVDCGSCCLRYILLQAWYDLIFDHGPVRQVFDRGANTGNLR